MKAKDYAETLIRDAQNCLTKQTDASLDIFVETINVTLRSLLQEAEILTRKRNVKLDSGMHAILLEQHNKWKAICRIHNAALPSMILAGSLFTYFVWRTPLKMLFIKYGFPSGVTQTDMNNLELQEVEQ